MVSSTYAVLARLGRAVIVAGNALSITLGLLLPPCVATVAYAQGARTDVQASTDKLDASLTTDDGRPSLYLSCPLECFESYLRQELSYFDFSRDPYRAEFTIVVVRQQAGNGGERFTVTLSPRTPNPERALTPATFTVPAGTADVVSRRKLAQAILRMLLAQLRGSEHEEAIELSLPARSGNALSTLRDPWDYWVVAPELSAAGEGGSGYYFIEGTGAVTVRRITEPSKVRLRGSYTRRWSGYLLEDGSRVRGDVDGWDVRAMYAHALGQHGALGGVANGSASEFENLSGHVHGGALAELNLFPYSENASRQLRFAYQAGVWANWYLEANGAGLSRELRPYHALSLIADVNQAWGSVQWIGQVNQFPDAPRLYRVSTGAILSVRVFEGLAVSFEVEAALVRDLINLRQRPVTDRELLLWTVQQPTRYTYEGELKLTYTFGSVHNTIVNPRFARVDLEEE